MNLKNLSVKKKLILLQLLVVFAVLVLYSVFHFLNDARVYRGTISTKLASMANILGYNCTSALNFRDSEDAARTLFVPGGGSRRDPRLDPGRVRAGLCRLHEARAEEPEPPPSREADSETRHRAGRSFFRAASSRTGRSSGPSSCAMTWAPTGRCCSAISGWPGSPCSEHGDRLASRALLPSGAVGPHPPSRRDHRTRIPDEGPVHPDRRAAQGRDRRSLPGLQRHAGRDPEPGRGPESCHGGAPRERGEVPHAGGEGEGRHRHHPGPAFRLRQPEPGRHVREHAGGAHRHALRPTRGRGGGPQAGAVLCEPDEGPRIRVHVRNGLQDEERPAHSRRGERGQDPVPGTAGGPGHHPEHQRAQEGRGGDPEAQRDARAPRRTSGPGSWPRPTNGSSSWTG